MGLSLSPEGGHEGHIREVLQEDRCSRMYSNYYALLSVISHSCIVLLFPASMNSDRNIDWSYFL
jgi:hypothetical protein